MKKIIAVCTTALLAVGLAIGVTAPASATGGQYETCVPQEAWTEVITPEVPATEGTPEIPAVYETITSEVRTGWQRYSWTGGPLEDGVVPSFPSDDWQPNVAGDPHGIGVEGAYDVSHGSSGKADWFYLEGIYETVTEEVLVSEAIPAVPGTPAIPAVTVEHPEIVCPPPVTEEPTTTTPLPPTFTDLCGIENDVVTSPENTDEYAYKGTLTEAGLASVTATAATGFVFEDGYTTRTWTYQFTNEVCPVVTPPVVYPPTTPPVVAVPPVVTPDLPNCDEIGYDKAQELLASDSVKYGYLDNNKDGIACDALAVNSAETLPETGSDTSATLGLGAVAFLLLLAGGAATLLAKRRKVATE